MPDGQVTKLRIHCICGQKMKVSAELFGRPGKCVACRQKIRIPNLDELPPNTDEVFLKNHPEFLRKSKARPVDDLAPGTPSMEAETPGEPGHGRATGTVALDVLEPLRILCSLERKLDRQEALLREQPGAAPAHEERLPHYRERLHAARGELDEELRQRLMEVAIELASTQEKTTAAGLAVRVGEMDYFEYRDRVAKLRRRRDVLERRQENLRGWLATHDPYVAGGYEDLDDDYIPKEGVPVTFPKDVDESHALLDWHVEGLREGLSRLGQAERKLAELDRLEAGGTDVATQRDVCGGAHARAASEVVFRRARLDQLKHDYTNEIQSVNSHIDLARGRRQVGEIDAKRQAVIERDLLRAKADLAKACDLITRALSANTAQDVPLHRGTFIHRLARAGQDTRLPVDSWLAWAAALVLLATLFLPAVGDLSPVAAFRLLRGPAPQVHWLITGPVLTALLLSVAACIPRTGIRGVLFSVICVVGAVAGVQYFHEAAGYDLGPLGERLRSGTPWFMRTGPVMQAMAMMGIALAAAWALAKKPGFRSVLIVAAVVAVAGMAAAATDLAGIRTARPEIDAATLPAAGSGDLKRVEVTVSNRGTRPLLLTSTTGVRNAYTYIFERRTGTKSWTDITETGRIAINGDRGLPPGAGFQNMEVAPGDEARFTYDLVPGIYQALLRRQADDKKIRREITIQNDSIPQEPSGEAVEPPPTRNDPETPQTVMPRMEVELGGIIAGKGQEPRFMIFLHMPGGDTRTRKLGIGGEVFDGWAAAEYNPDEKTVTLRKEDAILILRTGGRVPLEQPQR
jgi:hypothetical protein